MTISRSEVIRRAATIWPLGHVPHNAGLRAHRTTPDHVQPGDAVWVPEP